MEAARWCFVLICQTLLTEREEREGEFKKREIKKKLFIDYKVCTLLPRTDVPSLNLALLVSALSSLCLCLSCLSGSDGAAIVALCQAGWILVSTDTTPCR